MLESWGPALGKHQPAQQKGLEYASYSACALGSVRFQEIRVGFAGPYLGPEVRDLWVAWLGMCEPWSSDITVFCFFFCCCDKENYPD